MLHQKSQADALNSSFDEYNTNKPEDEHINNIKWKQNELLGTNRYTYSNRMSI